MVALNDAMKDAFTDVPRPLPGLTRDAILRAIDLKHTTVAVPEWGGSVRVRGMTAAERDAMLAAVAPGAETDKRSDSQIKAYLCAHCIVDAHGASLFADEDIALLQQKNPQVLDRLANEVLRLSGIGEPGVEVLEKN